MGRDTDRQGLHRVDADGAVDIQLDRPAVSVSAFSVRMR